MAWSSRPRLVVNTTRPDTCSATSASLPSRSRPDRRVANSVAFLLLSMIGARMTSGGKCLRYIEYSTTAPQEWPIFQNYFLYCATRMDPISLLRCKRGRSLWPSIRLRGARAGDRRFDDIDRHAALQGQDREAVVLRLIFPDPNGQFIDAVAVEIAHRKDLDIVVRDLAGCFRRPQVKRLQHPVLAREQAPDLDACKGHRRLMHNSPMDGPEAFFLAANSQRSFKILHQCNGEIFFIVQQLHARQVIAHTLRDVLSAQHVDQFIGDDPIVRSAVRICAHISRSLCNRRQPAAWRVSVLDQPRDAGAKISEPRKDAVLGRIMRLAGLEPELPMTKLRRARRRRPGHQGNRLDVAPAFGKGQTREQTER